MKIMKVLSYVFACINLVLGVLTGTQLIPAPSLFASTMNYILIAVLFMTSGNNSN